MSKPNLVEAVLSRDRAIVVVALAIIVVAAWAYILSGAGMGMSAFETSSLSMALGPSEEVPAASTRAMAAMATPVDWTFGYTLVMFFMWWVMMIAMMLPSAAPMILIYAKVDRSAKSRAGQAVGLLPTAAFTAGYLVMWALFSFLAAGLQWAFEGAGLLSPMMMNSTSLLFAGIILLFAGVYQLTPIKQACLKHCRGPIQFLSRHWRPGAFGAFAMGLHHGAYCLGCCWGLMAVLFFGGIMNLYWIVGLALIVLLEKVMPLGPGLGRVIGALLMLAGTGFVVKAAGWV